MTREEAEIYARNMSYEDALFNLTKAKAIPYKKATLIKVYELIKSPLQKPTVQDKQAESEKYQKAFDDGYANGYAQARFDYEQKPCNAVSQILKRMWNYRGKHTTSIDKVKMEQIIRDELSSVTSKPIECDDAISRDMALEKMADYVASGYADSAEDFEEYSRIICQLPSVTQKSGKWIMSDDGLYRPICDKCGAHPWKGYIPTVEEATEVFKYCPNCGAKMESEVSNG